MGSRKYAAAVAIMLIMLLVPVLLLQPSGAASAGLSRGISIPMDNTYHLLMYLTIGICAGWLGRESIVLLPFTVVIAMLAGMVVALDIDTIGHMRAIFLVLLFQSYALIAGIMRRRIFIAAQVVFGSITYWLGTGYAALITTELPLFYTTGGITLSVLLAASIGASIGVVAMLWQQHKQADTASHSI